MVLFIRQSAAGLALLLILLVCERLEADPLKTLVLDGNAEVLAVAFSSDAKLLASARDDSKFILWGLATGEAKWIHADEKVYAITTVPLKVE